MDAHDLNSTQQARSIHVANYLNAFTPYERARMLHQTELIWAERRRGKSKPAAVEPDGAENDARLLTGQWLANLA